MEYVAILIAAPQKNILDREIIRTASLILPGNPQVRWLSQGAAAQFHFFDEGGEWGAAADLRATLTGIPLDITIIPASEYGRKKILIADMDSTIIAQECIDEIAEEVGKGEQVSEITEAAMRGGLDFRSALRARIRLIEGLDETALAKVANKRLHLNPGARTLVQTMRANGAYCALVSGGFTYFTRIIAERAGFHDHRGNELLFENGCLSGVADPVLGREAKREALEDYMKRQNVNPADTLAVGDGANDLDMLEIAGFGIAYHAKPLVAEEARISINHADLTALLYLQGYSDDEFII